MRWAVLVVLAAALAATAAAHPNPTPEDPLAGVIREAMAVVRGLPDDVEQACADLDETAGKLSVAALFAPTRVIARLVTRAAETDELACGRLQGEGGDAQHTLRLALALKRDALNALRVLDFEPTGRTSTRAVRLGAPQCRGLQSRAAGAACFTLESWEIEIDGTAKAARCEFRDAEGRLLTNLRPLFKNVVQATTCRLTNRTVVVGAVEKRVVRAELTLTGLNGTAVAGFKPVVVTALWK